MFLCQMASVLNGRCPSPSPPVNWNATSPPPRSTGPILLRFKALQRYLCIDSTSRVLLKVRILYHRVTSTIVLPLDRTVRRCRILRVLVWQTWFISKRFDSLGLMIGLQKLLFSHATVQNKKAKSRLTARRFIHSLIHSFITRRKLTQSGSYLRQ
jgi:hypothetical protein